LEATSTHHLCAHVLEFVLQFDLLGDGHAILGDARRTERFLDHDVSPLRTEGDLDRIRQRIHSPQHPITGIG
jgi:hypothetical protein